MGETVSSWVLVFVTLDQVSETLPQFLFGMRGHEDEFGHGLRGTSVETKDSVIGDMKRANEDGFKHTSAVLPNAISCRDGYWLR